MKFVINSSELSKAIERVIKIVPSRPVMQILANIKLVALEDTVLLTAFDTASGIQLEVQSEVLESGEICVPAQAFSAIAKGMAGQLIIEVIGDTMTLTDLSGSCEIQCQQVDEYPHFIDKGIDKTIQCEIDIKTFVQAIKLGGSCAATDESKHILQGVNIVAQDGLLTMASTDGHRLIVYKTKVDESVKIPSSVIPAKVLSTIEGNGKMTLTIDEDTCLVNTSDTTLTCRLFAGKYPDYPKLLPKEFMRTATVERVQLIDALNLMSVISNGDSLVKFSFESSQLLIKCEKEGLKGERTIDCELDGEDLTLALNLKYLLGQLKIIPGERVLFSMNEALAPLTIRPASSELDLLCLLMPVQLRG